MRVVLADDSVLLREGIARLLEDAGFEVVAQSRHRRRSPPPRRHAQARRRARRHPDAADADGRGAPRGARRSASGGPTRACSCSPSTSSPRYAMELLGENAEGVGYLLKDRVSDVDEFAAAVRRVGEGGSALDPAVVSQLVGRRRRDDPVDELTPREREVLALMAEGRSNQASRRASSSPPGASRSTSPASSASSACPPPPRTIGVSSPS